MINFQVGRTALLILQLFTTKWTSDIIADTMFEVEFVMVKDKKQV